MKVAFVHDWLLGMRGGEKVLEAAVDVFPEADIFTLFHDRERVSETLSRRVRGVSWMGRLPGIGHYYRYMLPLMPAAISGLDLNDYELVLSSSHCVAKGVPLRRRGQRPRPLHVCYCHTPMRYVYDQFDHYFQSGSRPLLKFGARVARQYLVGWDRRSADGVDEFIANSENVRRRIEKAYAREATVIYPPTDTRFYTPDPRRRPATRPFFLISGALVPYKRVDLAIEACRRAGASLKIVGIGTEERRLRRLAAGAEVEFLGWQSPERLRDLYRDCAALLYPQEEDFGISAVEAMACGRPVLAYAAGGALESVIDGETGLLFHQQTSDALVRALTQVTSIAFDASRIRAHAERFSAEVFKQKLVDSIARARQKHRAVPDRRRVVQVIECGGPGGTGAQVAALCNGLDPARFDVTLLYSVRPGTPPQDYAAAARGAARRLYVPEMVREITPRSDWRAWWRLYRHFRRERPDIVHAHSSKAGFLARTAAWAADVPSIYYSPRGYSFLQTDRSPRRRVLYRALERLASRVGEVVAVSESEARLAREQARAPRVRVIRDAYLGEFPMGDATRAGNVVAACGRLSYARHPEAFARLAKELSSKRPGVRCVWIGGGELEAPMRELARELGIESTLEITGWLTHSEALRRMGEADVFVHYSRWEGLPNTVLEAMALGLPVVASDVHGNRDLVEPGRNGYRVAREEELLLRTLALLDDDGLRRELGRQGQELARAHYSRERLLGEISALYAG